MRACLPLSAGTEQAPVRQGRRKTRETKALRAKLAQAGITFAEDDGEKEDTDTDRHEDEHWRFTDTAHHPPTEYALPLAHHPPTVPPAVPLCT